MARQLLALDGIKPDKLDQYDRTLLWWASLNGHEGVAGLLLARHNINPVMPDNDRKTRLWSAACLGHKVVRLLLALDDLNPNKPNNDGQIPILAASIQYLLQLPVSTHKFKRKVVYHMQRYHLSALSGMSFNREFVP